jgi:ketosteroid isomerase-like protein
MRSVLSGWLKCAWVIVCLALLQGCAASSMRDSAESELRALESRWDEAIVRKDRAALQQILGDDFVIITADGQIGGKSQLMDVVASPDAVIDPFATEDVKVRVYGDAAVLTGRFTQTGSYKGQRFESQCLYTDVYAKRDHQWTAVSAQATCPGK